MVVRTKNLIIVLIAARNDYIMHKIIVKMIKAATISIDFYRAWKKSGANGLIYQISEAQAIRLKLLSEKAVNGGERGRARGKMLCEKSHLEYRNNDIKLSRSFYLNWFRVLVQQRMRG